MNAAVGAVGLALFGIIVVWPLLTYLGDLGRWMNDRNKRP